MEAGQGRLSSWLLDHWQALAVIGVCGAAAVGFVVCEYKLYSVAWERGKASGFHLGYQAAQKVSFASDELEGAQYRARLLRGYELTQ